MKNEKLKKAKLDIVYFVENFLVDSDTGKLFKLYDYQKRALSEAFQRDESGRFKFWELFFSWPRKDGKTEPIGTGIVQWFLYTRTDVAIKVIAPQGREHTEGIFAKKLKKSIEKNPVFGPITNILTNSITVSELGNHVVILPTEDIGALGFEDDLILFDEVGQLRPYQYDLYYNLQSGQGALIGKGRDALLVGVSTFGDTTDGSPMYDAYQRHLKGSDARLYFDYSDRNRNPLVTKEYLDRQEKILPRPVFLKHHRNIPGAKSGAAVSEDEFNACINHGLHRCVRTAEQIFVGCDAGYSKDSAGFGGVAVVNNVVQLRNLEVSIPDRDNPVWLPSFFGDLRTYLEGNPAFQVCALDPWETRSEYQKLASFYGEQRIQQYIFSEMGRKKLFKNFISLIKNRQFEIYWDNGEALALFKKQVLGLVVDSSWRVSHGKWGDDLVVCVAIACMYAVGEFFESDDQEEKPNPLEEMRQEALQAEEREYQRHLRDDPFKVDDREEIGIPAEGLDLEDAGDPFYYRDLYGDFF